MDTDTEDADTEDAHWYDGRSAIDKEDADMMILTLADMIQETLADTENADTENADMSLIWRLTDTIWVADTIQVADPAHWYGGNFDFYCIFYMSLY